MTLPNFIIIGAAKSGTTAIYHYLKQHPQVYMSPVKEANFFALEGDKLQFFEPFAYPSERKPADNIEAYCELFEDVTSEIAIGEASPWYLYSPRSAEKIHYYLPKAKLIAILRNPVERAFSHFLDFRRDAKEPLTDFAQALQEEEVRIRDNWHPLWHYKQMGFYSVQLKRYFDRFDRNQIQVYLYEDFKNNPIIVMQEIFRFINVDETFVPDMSLRHNVSGIPKNKALHIFLKTKHPLKNLIKPWIPERLRLQTVVNLRNRNLMKPPKLSLELRQQLMQEYRDDILMLQDLIERDLTKWIN